ncbi:hypothetical protein ACLOJK_018428 [Asimina triloba]
MHAQAMVKKQMEMKEEEEEEGRAREVEDLDSWRSGSETEKKDEMKMVMTEEQIEMLRRQISAYSYISHLLLHNTTFFFASRFSHQPLHSPLSAVPGELGNIWNDALMAQRCLAMTTRQRWAPTPAQLQVLECLFRQVNGTPSKEKIKEMTSVLAQYGQISETNVYNWFQNRRARSKRKQLKNSAYNLQTQVENEAVAPEENQEMSKSNPTLENATLVDKSGLHQSKGLSSKVCSIDPTTKEAKVTLPPTDRSKSSTAMVTYLSMQM